MVELLLSRTTVISLAIIGGVISIIVSWCKSRGLMSEQALVWLNKTAYAFMGVSMIFFIGAGMFGSGK